MHLSCWFAATAGSSTRCIPALWHFEALRSPANFTSLGYILALVGICTVFSVVAFHSAMIDWQIRTQRPGTAREFVITRDSWWPDFEINWPDTGGTIGETVDRAEILGREFHANQVDRAGDLYVGPLKGGVAKRGDADVHA